MSDNDYPDVLGTITGGIRYDFKTVQCALGIYPERSAVGQPFEILVILQSTIDQTQDVELSLRFPRKDSAGNRLSFFTPRRQVKATLGPGEVGLMQIPIIAQPPTPPSAGYPLILELKTKAAERFKVIRSPGAGRPPSALSLSPVRLEVLREVDFCGQGAGNQLRCRFNIIPGNVQVGLSNPTPRYEALWTVEDFGLERARIDESMALAEQATYEFVRGNIFHLIEEATTERFARAGLPLYPGESHFIAKTITYIYEDAARYEQDFDLHDARWFEWFCSLVVRDETALEADPGQLAAGELYFGAVYDAVCVGLPMVQLGTGRQFGSEDEHHAYAEKVVQALQSTGKMELGYAYLPLVMAGVQLHMRVQLRYEDMWESIDHLEESVARRASSGGEKTDLILGTLGEILENTKDLLHRSRISREE
jgi:hypothetical protein